MFDVWSDACCEWQLFCQTSWLACSIAQEGIAFANEPLGSGSSSFGVLPWRHCPVHLSVLLVSSNKTKHVFEPRKHYCHIHLACKSVGYERKMHLLIIWKLNRHSKKILCVLISLKYELYEVFLYWNFPDLR